MKNFVEKIKAKWEEDPLTVIFVGTLVAGVALKVVKARNESRNSRAWDLETQRRARMSR